MHNNQRIQVNSDVKLMAIKLEILLPIYKLVSNFPKMC
jgi:hypothetical protein